MGFLMQDKSLADPYTIKEGEVIQFFGRESSFEDFNNKLKRRGLELQLQGGLSCKVVREGTKPLPMVCGGLCEPMCSQCNQMADQAAEERYG